MVLLLSLLVLLFYYVELVLLDFWAHLISHTDLSESIVILTFLIGGIWLVLNLSLDLIIC